MSLNELLDVVSDSDEVLYTTTREKIYSKKLNFRVVNAFLYNSEGKFWIPRRHSNKTLFPLCLDCSVGGHVSSGEDYDSAFARETLEELNIYVKDVNYKKIARLTPKEHKVSAFMWIYIIYTDEVPNFNKEDFVEYYWFTPEELLERLKSNDKGKNDLRFIVESIKNIL